MNAEKYFRLLREVKDVSFATVDEAGRPSLPGGLPGRGHCKEREP